MRIPSCLTLSLVLTACGAGGGKVGDTAGGDTGSSGTGTDGDCFGGDPSGAVDPGVFSAAALSGSITEEACILTDGTETTCLRIPLPGAPADFEVGPFCPRRIDDDADAVGVWIDGGTAYDVDGDFIVGLSDFYEDDHWQLYDSATGEVFVTDTEASCEAAARPDVDPEYQNHCVECSLDYVDGGVSQDVLVPKVPVAAASPSELGTTTSVGASVSGVVFAPPAPVDAILSAYTIAAFDDCGGHVNLVDGYHLHTPAGCGDTPETCDAHAPLLGVALDGYGIYAGAAEGESEPDDLDECRGHEDDVRGYHYHAASMGENLFIGCFHGERVDDGSGDGGPGGGGAGEDAIDCDEVDAGMPCCGDDVCDGPETADNCPEDCA